jgi:hypothetical protein
MGFPVRCGRTWARRNLIQRRLRKEIGLSGVSFSIQLAGNHGDTT